MSKMKTDCFPHRHMTFEEYGVYQYIMAVSYATGTFYLDGRRLALEFATTGKDSAYRVIKRLEAKGWIALTFHGGRSKNGTFVASQYHPIDHADWADAHPGQCRANSRKSETGPSPDSETYQSGFPEPPVSESRHNLVKKTQYSFSASSPANPGYNGADVQKAAVPAESSDTPASRQELDIKHTCSPAAQPHDVVVGDSQIENYSNERVPGGTKGAHVCGDSFAAQADKIEQEYQRRRYYSALNNTQICNEYKAIYERIVEIGRMLWSEHEKAYPNCRINLDKPFKVGRADKAGAPIVFRKLGGIAALTLWEQFLAYENHLTTTEESGEEQRDWLLGDFVEAVTGTRDAKCWNGKPLVESFIPGKVRR